MKPSALEKLFTELTTNGGTAGSGTSSVNFPKVHKAILALGRPVTVGDVRKIIKDIEGREVYHNVARNNLERRCVDKEAALKLIQSGKPGDKYYRFPEFQDGVQARGVVYTPLQLIVNSIPKEEPAPTT